jgi:uncharacterized membrane protein YheB (UPF0754 family)
MKDKKSFMTNLISLVFIIAGHFSPYYGETIKMVGLFAFSGAMTNWLAIYMLFERVPFLYGSGIIPLQFAVFKTSIKKIMMEQFFHENNIQQFFSAENTFREAKFFVADSIESFNYEKLYEGLITEMLNTSLGKTISLFGGADILKPLKEPCMKKFKTMFHEIVEVELWPKLMNDQFSEKMKDKIEEMIDTQLQALTPQQVKMLVKEMINKYLGWVVVWGGFFGGFIGLLANFGSGI